MSLSETERDRNDVFMMFEELCSYFLQDFPFLGDKIFRPCKKLKRNRISQSLNLFSNFDKSIVVSSSFFNEALMLNWSQFKDRNDVCFLTS